MTEYQEYPLTMAHPAYHPGDVGREVRSPHGFTYYEGGKPVRFPPVTVGSADDEEYYAAQGYKRAGKSDPAAYARAHAVAAEMSNYEPKEYPKWVGDRLVNSPEEEAGAPPVVEAAPVEPEKSAIELENEALKAQIAALMAAQQPPPEEPAADVAEDQPLTRGQKAWATRQARQQAAAA